MTRSSDLVMVEREVLERIEFSNKGYCPACDGWMVDEWRGATPGKHTPTCELAKAIFALQSVEGGVQGSIATKQESCPESAPRTETAPICPRCDKPLQIVHACWHCDDCSESFGFAAPGPSDAQLTKTPSADHDAGNLRSLSAPNHQPHAVSQGFDFHAHLQRQRDWSGKTFGPGDRAKGVVDHIRKELTEIENDPTDLTEWIDVAILALDGAWRSGASPEQIIAALTAKQTKNENRVWPDWRTSDPNKAIEHDRYADVRESPLPAPPSPAKTGGAS